MSKASVPTSTSKSSINRRDKSAHRIKRPISPGPNDGFIDIFITICEEMGVEDVPIVKTMSTEPLSWVSSQCNDERAKSAISNKSVHDRAKSLHQASELQCYSIKENYAKNHMFAVYDNPDNLTILNTLICKNIAMENNLVGVLQTVLKKCGTLKILKLQFCNLTSEQLKAVKFLISQCETIVDLNLDGNPIPYQNHYILLKDTKLLQLSLKFCKINAKGASKIAAYLTYPSAITLVSLILSNNFIEDEGCKLLADALRTNRTLTHFCLSDNLITDKGCIYLMQVLQKFSLWHDEILFRRKCNMEYLLRKMTRSEKQGPNKKSPEIPKIEKKQKSSSSMRFKKDKISVSSAASSVKKQKRISSPVASDIVEKDSHPYMHECISENQEVYCKGNYKLTYLNLAYNCIASKGATAIKEMLEYQYLTKRLYNVRGVSEIVLEGNRIDEGSMKEIFDIFENSESVIAVSTLAVDIKKPIKMSA